MAKVAGNEVRPGMVIEHNGQLWSVVKTQSVKPGKGGTYNQVELKNILNGGKLNERFRAAETVEEVQLDRRDFQFLYASGDMLTFMDLDSYDQIELHEDFVGERTQFLQDGMKVVVQLHEGRPIGISLPQHVVLRVTEADPVQRGQTAASSYKSAMLENGMRTLVPPFIEAGTRIIVSTDDASYVKRAD
jgi:elongation factor P